MLELMCSRHSSNDLQYQVQCQKDLSTDQLGSNEGQGLVNDPSSNGWCRQGAPTLPKALQEAPVIAVCRNSMGRQEVKLYDLDAPCSQLALEVCTCPPLGHDHSGGY